MRDDASPDPRPTPSAPASNVPSGAEAILRGGGEMGVLMRAVDWSKTPVGPVEAWPQSLKTALSILLESKFGTMVAWGTAFTHFYNDAYRPILGSSKHPSLGKGVPEVFPEIWDTIGPLFAGVMQGTAVGFDDLMVPLDRHGYLEEIYFTFAYTPIRDEAGAVGGILVTVAETTMRLIQERRLRTLRDLALRAAQESVEAQVWLGSAETLSSNDADVPFALLYALGPDSQHVTLAASTANLPASIGLPQIHLDAPDGDGWPVGTVMTSNVPRLITDVEARFGPRHGHKWPEPIRHAFVLPIRRSGTIDPYGALVVGISPRRGFDDDYADFCRLIADQIAAAVANARAHAEERKRADALAEIARAKTAFFMQAPVPMSLVVGPEMIFELANQPYLEMIGRSAVIGKSIREVFAELPADAALFQLLRGVYESGRPFTTDEYRVPLARSGDGKIEDVFFRFTCQAMRGAGGEIEGLMTVAVDITPQVNARADAELASRAKDEFLAVLGHELRNPLAPMVTALRLMNLKGIRADELAIMERQVGALVRLVDDLMDVSRITRGKIELRKSRVELSSIVLRGLETASPLLEQRRHRIDLHVPTAGLPIEGDAVRLAQVVANLLTNAAKYSDPGSEIHVVADRTGDADGRVRLRIRDHGIGIAPAMLHDIFEMFVQQPQALDRAKGGIGLGLAIARSLVELHQGKVWASSDGPGAGSTFVVELPLVPGVQPAHPASASRREIGAVDRAEGRLGRILIVDDNEDAALTLAEYLTELGYEVRTAHDGPSGLDVANAFRPTICLLDIGLPVMDGYEVARRLRQLEALPRGVRLLALTGYGQESDRRLSAAAGFDDHLVKPIDLEELAKSLRS